MCVHRAWDEQSVTEVDSGLVTRCMTRHAAIANLECEITLGLTINQDTRSGNNHATHDSRRARREAILHHTLATAYEPTRVSTMSWHSVERLTSDGIVRGSVGIGEDVEALVRLVAAVKDRTLAQDLPLLTHADLGADKDDREAKRNALKSGRLKRFVVRVHTDVGSRIVKVAETVGFGNMLQGLVGGSIARREHHNQLRAQELELAATQTAGYLELRRGSFLKRAIQIQSELDPTLPTWTDVLETDMQWGGDVAIDRAARALAATHALGFFHADLKGFHAFVPEPRGETYGLVWLDLGRVAFHLTPRKRIVNLYQALRFVVPRRPEAEERFVKTYCQASGWQASTPDRALTKVRDFLTYKLRTHPDP